MERNWDERAYQDEYAREKARLQFKIDIEKQKKNKIIPYILPACIGITVIALFRNMGDVIGFHWGWIDRQFILIITFLVVIAVTALVWKGK